MKRIIRYNATGDTNTPKSGIIEIIKHLIYTLYTPLCHLLLLIAAKRAKSKRYRVVICAIFKDEAKDLREWICYHRLIGVEHLYLYNNFSKDDYLDALKPFIESGEVTLIDWEHQYGQKSAYDHCIKNFAEESNWIAFIDIDEFIALREEHSLSNWLKGFEGYPSVMLNWKFFGTSGLMERDCKRLVIEQFDSSWASYTDVGKSIINTAFLFDECNHVHRFRARLFGLPIYAVDEFKSFVIFWIYRRRRDSRESKAQLNHYWSKSQSDFLYKDMVRGDALSQDTERQRRENSAQRFNYHEQQNTVKDYTIQRYLIALKVAVSRL